MNHIIFALLLMPLILWSQEITNTSPDFTNVIVRFMDDNQPYSRITNYPSEVSSVDFSTNAPGWSTNMLVTDYLDYVRSIQMSDAWIVGKSNQVWIANNRRTVNLQRLLALYDLIPQGRSGCSNSAATFSTIEASLASGTNTQAQVVNRIRQLNQEANSVNTRQAYILEYLQRLGPELKALYKPDQDPAQ